MKTSFITILFIFLVALVACHKKTAPVVSARTAFPPAPSPTRKPVVETSPEAIAAGKVIFETRCNRCHALKDAGGYTTERWTTILGSMIPRARLNDEQAKQLTSYIMSGAK